jgi:hypothetical protein
VTAEPPVKYSNCWVPNPSCGSVGSFRSDIVSWLQVKLRPIGGTLIFLAVIMFLTICGACFIMRAGRKSWAARQAANKETRSSEPYASVA